MVPGRGQAASQRIAAEAAMAAKQAELDAAPTALRRMGACERPREGSCPIVGAFAPEAANA